MKHWKKLFLFPIQFLFSHLSRPFSSNYWTQYSSRIQNYTKSGTLQIICVLFANVNQEQCSTSFMIALVQFLSGKISNHITYLWQNSRYRLNLKDTLIGLLTPEFPLLNYLLLIGKIYLWGCRRNEELPSIRGFKSKVKLKYETEKYICTKNNNLDMLRKKWAI